MNRRLKSEILLRFDSQGDCARALNINESRLSRVIRERVLPSEKEMIAFRRVFGEGIDTLLLPQIPQSRASGFARKYLADQTGSVSIEPLKKSSAGDGED